MRRVKQVQIACCQECNEYREYPGKTLARCLSLHMNFEVADATETEFDGKNWKPVPHYHYCQYFDAPFWVRWRLNKEHTMMPKRGWSSKVILSVLKGRGRS